MDEPVVPAMDEILAEIVALADKIQGLPGPVTDEALAELHGLARALDAWELKHTGRK